MLTDWERRQLAEIERGLTEDFTLRRRAGRLVESLLPWAAAGVLVFLGCLVVLMAIGAWHLAIALTVIYGLVTVGRARRRDRDGAGSHDPRRR